VWWAFPAADLSRNHMISANTRHSRTLRMAIKVQLLAHLLHLTLGLERQPGLSGKEECATSDEATGDVRQARSVGCMVPVRHCDADWRFLHRHAHRIHTPRASVPGTDG
jgi:hypothetical protein